MRELVDRARIERLMSALGRATDGSPRVYFTGGATAVLIGWRASTIDVDIAVVPDTDSLLRAIPSIKEELSVNVELASPAQFIPVPAGWEDRSPFVAKVDGVSFFHFDLYGQALAKVERGHARDRADVAAMLERGLITKTRARDYFAEIEPELYRFPAIDPPTFCRAIEEAFGL
jgi:hypothetical protein